MPSTVWIQFVKQAKIGAVKTRIAADVGDKSALKAHLELARAVNFQLSSFCDTEPENEIWLAIALIDECLHDAGQAYKRAGLKSAAVLEQPEKELGERMTIALSEAKKKHDFAFIVGSDFPLLDNEFLSQAKALLDRFDVVIAPTEDGGFGLIGTHLQQLPSLESIEWGTDKACQQTVERLRSGGCSVATLIKRFDVDTELDLNRWRNSRWYPFNRPVKS